MMTKADRRDWNRRKRAAERVNTMHRNMGSRELAKELGMSVHAIERIVQENREGRWKQD
jgi:transposase